MKVLTPSVEPAAPPVDLAVAGRDKGRERANSGATSMPRVALLTGGGDKHYAFGLASALASKGVLIDFVASDHLVDPTIENNPRINFLNLRGNQDQQAGLVEKVRRLTVYYLRLLKFAATTRARVFHILWNNKFESFDRTVLLLYYKLCRKRIVFTAHNVNAARRDAFDNWFNRFTLYLQYHLVDHIFAHTNQSREELRTEFGVALDKISVIPYGINDAVPTTPLLPSEAKRRLGVGSSDRTMLFFGLIAPYKGLEYLLTALAGILAEDRSYRLLIAGKPKWDNTYWLKLEKIIADARIGSRITQRIQFIPDEEVEVFFKAADVLVMPYTEIFQSGILFLAYSFGLPVIATDVGALKEEIVEGRTGFLCAPRDAVSLAEAIRAYFTSDLFKELDLQRAEIKAYASERHSWDAVAEITASVYGTLAP